MAVGNPLFNGSPTAFEAMDEFWNGTDWNITFGQRLTANANSQFSAVACTSASSCEAVGNHVNSGGTNVPLAEAWNGTSWALQPTDAPGGAVYTQLNGVSCTSKSACTAVGFFADTSGYHALVERWDGSSWTIQFADRASGVLNAVSCASATACMAVGYSGLGNLAESWNGNSWTPVLLGTYNGATSSVLNGVSCVIARYCVAVGRQAKAGSTSTLAVSWDGSGWTLLNPLNPSSTYSSLDAVSCAFTGGLIFGISCQAVGEEAPGPGYLFTQAQVWDGAWSYEGTGNPGYGTSSRLDGVSCSSAASCTAVGSYRDSSSTRTLAERFSGGGSPHGLSLTRRGDVLALLRKPRTVQLFVFKLGPQGHLLGAVSLGHHRTGRSTIGWDLRVGGHRLHAGNYTAELVAAFGRGATSGGPSVTFKLTRAGRVRVLSATCSVAAATRGRC